MGFRPVKRRFDLSMPDSRQKLNFTVRSRPVLCRPGEWPQAKEGNPIMSSPSIKRHGAPAGRAPKGGALMAGALAAVLSLLACPPAHAQVSPLLLLSGSWAGAGTVAMASGTKERIRCRSTYQVDGAGSNVVLDLRCASDSYKFELKSNITYSDGELRGTWDEITRSVGGQVTGRAAGGQIQATALGQTFTAILAMNTKGNSQSISIRSPGSELSEAVISLTRGGGN
jgi:hypothetical protein